jgi:hypothetical protein
MNRRSSLGGPIFGSPAILKSGLLVIPVIVSGKGAIVLALGMETLDTVWTYRTTAPVFSNLVASPDEGSGTALTKPGHDSQKT